ncbi:MAG: AAA family ATPase, partial [Saprospiraceae bacterium]|nr:AAA family ATPase [Saprospiraceae bacterium]
MNKARFPYGVSNFETLITDGYIYVDRTKHIETLERLSARYQFFLRPRRFGKSLFLSVLEYYYAQEHRNKFERLFGGLYIGQHPTPLAGKYLVLKFDFSGIETEDITKVYRGFLSAIQKGILSTLYKYPQTFPDDLYSAIESAESPVEAMSRLLTFVQTHASEKLFILIDEYDHFTNELIAFHFDNFQEIVSRNGFVRKFYEVLKEGTQRGVIDRMFITGVSPITLDSLTSGFNIGSNLSLDLELHDLMGFREEEVAHLLHHAGVLEEELPQVVGDVRTWYNGYRFHRQAPHRLYNPDMVLYFAEEYARYRRYPERLLDINVSSDYGKIGRMLRVGDEKANWQLLEQLLEDG